MRLLFLLAFATLQATPRDWMAQLRAGAFIPKSHLLQKIYGRAWIEGEVEIAYTFIPAVQGWGNATYFYEKAHSDRHLQVYTASAGLKYILPTHHVRPYAGIGPCYTFLHFKNHPGFGPFAVYKNRFGYVVKTGLYIDLPKHLFLDLFFDDYFQRMRFRKGDLNAGGFRTGVGLGCTF